MIYYVCKYTPIELLESFGVPCARLEPTVSSFDCADSCAHPNLCGYGKAVIETVLTQEIRELILTDCCDVMRRVYDVLAESGKLDFLRLLPLPHKSDEAEARLLGEELRRLQAEYAAYRGTVSAPADLLVRWRGATAETEPIGAHLSLSGAHGGAHLLQSVQSRFSLPVTDDTCSGGRVLPAPDCGAAAPDLLTRYAAALLRQHRPCMRMLEIRGRTEDGAVGIIYHTMKFCDYYGFEYMHLHNRKQPPLLKIETDCTAQSEGQLRTRLDAFAETLRVQPSQTSAAPAGPVRYAAGVDSGSTSTDAVVLDAARNILGRAILPTGAGAAAGAEQALALALSQAGIRLEDLGALVTTGYGRETVGLPGASVTEITCHARGAHFLHPAARTVIDIGGQDSKVICLGPDGQVENFAMNDKCAAGTGRFLELMARTLDFSLDEMGQRGLEWTAEVSISSMCTVFAESEVVSLVSQNTPAADIIHGLNRAVAAKTHTLVRRANGGPEYIMTGGVARNPGVVRALEEKLGAAVFISEDAQLCGAIGAALLGLEHAES